LRVLLEAESSISRGQGFWLNIALGIIGALVGGFLFDLVGARGITGFNIWSMVVAIIGSVVVLLIYNAQVAAEHGEPTEQSEIRRNKSQWPNLVLSVSGGTSEVGKTISNQRNCPRDALEI